MEEHTFLGADLVADPDATRRATEQCRAVDAAHCAECATFVAALGPDAPLHPLAEIVRQLGGDPQRPADVSGAVDGHFLFGEWALVAQFRNPPRTERALMPDLRAWFEGPSALLEPSFAGLSVIVLRFEWTGAEVAALARRLGVHPDESATA